MTKHADCLIEIHTEELPPKAQKKLMLAFQQQMEERLRKENLSFSAVRGFVAPRRLAVIIDALADAQPDQIIERKGPALGAAFDQNGVPSKACEGFARSCHVTPKELLTIRTDQGEWVGFNMAVKGKPLAELLPAMVEQAALALPISKRMRWGSSAVEFVRPVHSVILLHGKKVIPAEILGCKTGNVTHGHRFMADVKIKISAASDYESMLEKDGKVIVDFNRRRDLIRAEAEKCLPEALAKKGKIIITDDLLDEVTGLVEWPVAMCGQFDKEFLTVPKEVLMSSMQDHQRYFPVADNIGNLLPLFVFISNIKSKKPQQVLHGNERVLRARLADAKFFFDSDKQEKLDDRVARLKDIVYQAKLGTLHDKAERLSELTAYIAKQIGVNVDHAKRAGLLAKADLVTSMVGEFPELQGVMGEYLARHDSESEDIVVALREQYLPRFAGDTLPENKLGMALALADRLDLLVGSFVIGQIPTGDKDPYGLRRAALGMVRILVENQIDLDISKLIQRSAALYSEKVALAKPFSDVQVLDFIKERMRAWYQEQGVTPDVFAAVAALDVTNLLDFDKRIQAVKSFKKLGAAEALSIANKRVKNILDKNQDDGQHTHKVCVDDLIESAEKILATELQLRKGEIDCLSSEGKYDQVLLKLASLREPVDNFFDKVMVMDENEKLRKNRISILRELRGMFLRVADIALLQ